MTTTLTFNIGDKVVFNDPLDGMDFYGTVTRVDTFTNRISIKWDLGGTDRMNPASLKRV